jgi:hypothetical protein
MEWSYHVKSMNFMSVRRRYFLGRGLGAGESTVSDWASVSTPVLHGEMVTVFKRDQ